MTATRYSFLPWARPGLKELPSDPITAPLPSSPRVSIEVAVNENPPVRMEATLDGPGDVLGLDPGAITRMEPAPGTRTFEPNYLAAVEFRRPDLPWLFTPATADAQNRLRPWLVLAVVRKQPGVTLIQEGNQLARLELKAPARPADELPDLAQSWAWAHAQVAGGLAPGATVERLMGSDPARTGSRLLCARRLQRDTEYLACVVPAFEAGRLAGLGLPLDGIETLEPAWKPSDPTVTLPVYRFWEFATGPAGDFESLVKLLVERPKDDVPALTGRIVDAADAGEGLPPARVGAPEASRFTLECPLVPLGSTRPELAFIADFVPALGRILRTGAAGAEPRLLPPFYAGPHVGLAGPPAEGVMPAWLFELNLDPRFRVPAALGGDVVRRSQQRLVDSAWDQAGEIAAANTLLRHAQAAAAAASAIHRRHLARLGDSALFEVTRPLHGRLMMGGQKTVHGLMASTGTPTTLVDAAFRRVARPRGPLFRRVLAPPQRSVRPFLTAFSLQRLTIFGVRPSTPFAQLDSVEERFRPGSPPRAPGAPGVAHRTIVSHPVDQIPKRPGFAILPPSLSPPPPVTPLAGGAVFGHAHLAGVLAHAAVLTPAAGAPPPEDNVVARNFRQALRDHQPLIQPKPIVMFARRPALDVGATRPELFARLAPAAPIAGLVQSMIQAGDGAPAPQATLDPIRTAPEFPEPLYASLGALSPDLVVQGFETIPNNSIAALETNQHFVEAFLAGANHEMARELLWREFPVDARATFFRRFWDSVEGTPPDIPPIAEWSAAGGLGAQGPGAGTLSVFLIRGDLLRRYPAAIVSLVKAAAPGTPGTEERHPVLRGTLSDDAAFFGFPIAPGEVAAEPGWFFVIQEPSAEPRFGVEVDEPEPDKRLRPAGDAAATAQALLQRPVRVAVHARDLLKGHG